MMSRISHPQTYTENTFLARWPQWIGYAAALWSLIYGALGLYWMLGGSGFPLGSANDPQALESSFSWVQVGSGALVMSVLGLAGTLAALVMVGVRGRGVARTSLLIFAWVIAAALLVVIPDRRVLMAVAYAPIFLVGIPFHFPPVSFLKAIPWPVINQFILMAGGLLWALTALSYQRRTRGACAHCGRGKAEVGTMRAERAARWGKWAVALAVITPVLYAATRYIWALGIPLGISEQVLREGQVSGLWIAGAGLATVAVGGAILTLGLAQRWGEIFPRWMIGLAGKRVPPMLAVVPATFVSLCVTSAGLEYVRLVTVQAQTDIATTWTTMGPELLWPIWGVALAVATLAYYQRRSKSERCKYCNER